MILQEAYKIMQQHCGIKVGDKVRVLRGAKYCEMGWDIPWMPDMNNVIGKGVGEVIKLCGDRGIYLQFENMNRKRYFPFFVLEKVESAPVPELTLAEVCEKLGYEVKIKKE